MSTAKIRRNPFDLVKASDFSDEQILQYWVDLSGEAKLHDLFQPTLAMPMMLLGGKGSGKTHLMRYYSSAVRKLSREGSLIKSVCEDGYLGVYVRADGLNVGRFSGKGQSDESWAAVFSYYFELWLATNYLRFIYEGVCEQRPSFEDRVAVETSLAIFNRPVPADVNGIGGLIEYFTGLRKEIDHVVSNVATGRASLADINICIAPGDLVFGLAEIFSASLHWMKDVLTVYMIDEIENFTRSQQRFLNSLIRYRRGSVTFKVGCRLYGIRTRKTLDGSEEEIRQGAEFDQVLLDEWLRAHADAYHTQAKQLITNRLRRAGFPLEDDLNSCFTELDSSDHYRNETLAALRAYDERGQERPYFQHLRRLLLRTPLSLPEDEASKVIGSLTVRDYPILEKVNIYLLSRDWSPKDDLIKLSSNIGSMAHAYLKGGRKSARDYDQVLSHFKSDFLAQIFREAGDRKVIYSGLSTLVHLSQGVPRNLLGLMKHIYRRAQFSGERPFERGSKISVQAQGEGIRDASAWFWEDAQPDSHGFDARLAVQAVAEFFSAVRFSIKPAECDLSTFTVASDVGSDVARQVLKHAENWSYLVKVQGGGVDRNDRSSLNDKYQLSPMLAPRWGISEHRRGAIQLNERLFNAMFDPAYRGDLSSLLEERLHRMQNPFGLAGTSDGIQGRLI